MRSFVSAIENFGSEFVTESTQRSTRRRWTEKKRTKPRVIVLRNNLRKEMPSVEMRRTTRVFGMGKGVDGARVLRSGRRLWPESSVVKLDRNNGDEDEEWLKLIKNHGDSDAIGMKHRGWSRAGPKPKPNVVIPVSRVVEKPVQTEGIKRFGVVYSRKRKRTVNVENRMYGQRFTRKKRKTSLGAPRFDSDVNFASPVQIEARWSATEERRQARVEFSAQLAFDRIWRWRVRSTGSGVRGFWR